MGTGTQQRTGALVRAAKVFLLSAIFVSVILLAGVGMVAMVANAWSTETWSRWSNAGQAFGVLTAVVSGLAVVALVVTFWLQLQELKAQRLELCQQRELVSNAQAALQRSAAAHLSAQHSGLIRMAIEDHELAEVWPALQPGLTPTLNRQFLYANLMIQHVWLKHRVKDYTEAELRSTLRYFFGSPVMREYWLAVQGPRARVLVPGTDEFRFDEIAREVFREYEEDSVPVDDHSRSDSREEPETTT